MEIIVAKSSGFCNGVKTAYNKAMEFANQSKSENISILGELVHNKQVICELKEKGIQTINELTEIDTGTQNTILIRTHGIPPNQMEYLKKTPNIKIIDKTCANVKKVQKIIRNSAEKNETIFIIGKKNHPEVIGHLGYSSGKGYVINNKNDIPDLATDTKICIVAQTTQSQSVFNELSEIIQNRYRNSYIIDTICKATLLMQKEVKELCQKVDAFIIIGGKNSSNTKELANIVINQEMPVFHIETPAELDLSEIKKYEKIGISAGASTSYKSIEETVEYLKENQ